MKVSPHEGALHHKEASLTAANAQNPLYKPSGSMLYRVVMQTAVGATVPVDVEADSGDAAAAGGLNQFPGGKVVFVGPAPQKAAE